MQTSLCCRQFTYVFANECLLCFLVTQVIQKPYPVYLMTSERNTFLSTTPPRKLDPPPPFVDKLDRHSWQHCPIIVSGLSYNQVWCESPSSHTLLPICITARLLESIRSFDCPFLHLHWVVVWWTPLVSWWHSPKPTPHVCPQMRLVLIALFPFLQARWFFLAEPHEDSLCSFSVPTDP